MREGSGTEFSLGDGGGEDGWMLESHQGEAVFVYASLSPINPEV